MRDFRINKEPTGLFQIVDYYTPYNLKELIEEYNSKSLMSRGSAPICGGPVVAWFNNEELAEEYVKFKNGKLNEEKDSAQAKEEK